MSHAIYFYHDVKAQTVQTVLTQGVYKLQSFKNLDSRPFSGWAVA